MVTYRRLLVVLAATVALGIVPLTEASAHSHHTSSVQTDPLSGLPPVGPVYTPDGGHTWCC